MIAIIPLIIAAVNISVNATSFWEGGLLRVSTGVYIGAMGDLFFGIIFGFIGAGLYINKGSIGTLFVYLAMVCGIFIVVLGNMVAGLFSFMLVIVFAIIMYRTWVEKTTN